MVGFDKRRMTPDLPHRAQLRTDAEISDAVCWDEQAECLQCGGAKCITYFRVSPKLAKALQKMGHAVNTVRKLLGQLGYGRRANRKANGQHADRDAQFEHINAQLPG